MKRLGRIVVGVVIALAVGCGVVGANPELAAADGLCQDAPPPVSPREGMVGLVTKKPADIPGRAADPFKDIKAPIGDVYGYQWQWTNFDLGCGNDFLRDPLAVSNTKSANMVLGLSGAMIAGHDAMERMAKDSPLDWLRDVVVTVSGSLSPILLGINGGVGWLGIAVIIVGVVVVARARSTSYADMARLVGIVAAALVIAVGVLLFPAKASQALDKGVTEIADLGGGAFTGSLTDSVNRESGYRIWLAGYFGSADSDLATDLGPRLMSATHYTWSDVARMDRDPSSRTAIDAAKAAEFKAVAGEVKQRSPSAYETFTGRGERIGVGVVGLVSVLCMVFFGLIAFTLVLVGRVMMQALVIAAPIAAALGMIPPRHAVLAKMWDLFTAAALGVAKFMLGAGVMSMVIGGIASSSRLSNSESVFWIIVVTVVALMVLKPVRTFKTFLPGVDPHTSMMRGLLGKVIGGLAIAKGLNLGGFGGRKDHDADPTDEPVFDDPPHDGDQRPNRRVNLILGDSTRSREALPAPRWADQPAEIDSGPQVEESPELQPGARRWSGVLPTGRHRELPVGSGETFARTEDGEEPRPRRSAGFVASQDGVVASSSDEDAVDTSRRWSSGSRVEVARRAEFESSGDEPTPVVYPTGVVIADDPGRYHAEGSAPNYSAGQYVRLDEHDVDGGALTYVSDRDKAGANHAA